MCWGEHAYFPRMQPPQVSHCMATSQIASLAGGELAGPLFVGRLASNLFLMLCPAAVQLSLLVTT